MTIEEIKSKVEYGDYNRIAQMVGCSRVYVSQIISGKRNIKSPKSKQVYDTAVKYYQGIEKLTVSQPVNAQ